MAAAAVDHHADIDKALESWRQGEVILAPNIALVHLAKLTQPLTPASCEALRQLKTAPTTDAEILETAADGFIVLTQTCDLVRDAKNKPYAHLALLRPAATSDEFHQTQRCERPSLAYVPAVADRNLVADLNRMMTVEKSILASFDHIRGVRTANEAEAFAEALSRHRRRFAFPDDFNTALAKFQKRLKEKAGKSNSEEGKHVDALSQIRVAANPSWDAEKVAVTLWLIKRDDPDPAQWPKWTAEWVKRIDQTGRYVLDGEPRLTRLEDLRASEYLSSQQLDLDHLS
jgi:hypothetical protein